MAEKKVTKYRNIALLGIVIMAIGSFMACLSSTNAGYMIGSILLILSIILTSYGFTYWQP